VTGQSGTGQGGQTVSVFGSDTGIGNAALGADGQAKPSTGTAQGNGTIDGTAFTGTSNGDGSSGLGQETSGLSGQGDGLLGTALTGSLDRDTGFGFFGTDFGSQGAVASSTLDGSTGIESLASGSRFGSSAPVPAPVAPAFVSTGSDAVGQSIGLSGASGASLPDLAPDSDAFVDQFLEMSQPELAQPALEQFVSNALPEQIPHIASSIPETAEEFITSSDNIAEISESVEFADDVAQADVPVPEDPFGEETETAAFEGGAGLDGGFEENGLDDFADTAGSEDAFADAGQLGEDFGDGGFVSDSQAFAGDGSVGDTDSLGQEVDTAETGFDTGTGSDEVFDDRVDDLLADLVSDGLGDDQSNLGDSFEMAGEIGQTDSFETSDEIGGEVDSGSFEDSSGFEEEGSATFADDGDAGFEEVLADAEGNVDEIDEEGFATDQAELDQDEDFTDVDSFAENGGDEFDIALANDGFEKENGQPVLESTVEESDLEDFDSGGGEFIDGGEVQSQDAFTEEEGISNEFDIAEGDTSFEEDDFSEQDGFETEENLAGSDPDLMSDDTPNDFDTAMTAGDPEGFGRGNEEALLDPFAASDEPVNAEEDFADLEDSQDSFSDSDEGLSDQIADVEPVEADPEPDQLALADVEALSPETEANASPPTEQEDTAAETPENDDMAAAMSTLGGRNHMFATTDFNKVLRIENDLDSGRRTRDQLTQEETNVLAQAEMINDYIYNNHRTLNEDFDQTQEIMSDVERANNQTNADLAESFDDVVNAQEVLVGLRTAQLAGEVVQLISPVIDRVTTTVEIAGSAYEASSFVKKTNLATGVTEITARQTRGIQLTVKKTTTVESLADLMPQGVKNLDFGAKSINLARDILPSQSGNEATLTAGSSATGQQFAQQLRQGAGQSGTAARDQVGSSTQQTPAQSSAAFISRRSEQAANFSSVAAGGAEILANQLPNAGSGLSNFGNTAAAVGTGFSTLQHGARAYETGDVGSGITAGAYAVDTGLNLYNGVSKFRGGTGLLRLGRIANLGGAVDAGFNLYKDSAELIRLNNSGPVRVTNSQQARREAALEGRVAYMRYLRNRGRQRP
jgi:hypothetical protein